MNGCGHVVSRCDRMSITKLGNKCAIHIWVCDWPIYIYTYIHISMVSIYCAYWNLRDCVIDVSDIFEAFQKWFESLWWVCSLESHLSTYANLDFALLSYFLYDLYFMYLYRLRISWLCSRVGILLSQYGIV